MSVGLTQCGEDRNIRQLFNDRPELSMSSQEIHLCDAGYVVSRLDALNALLDNVVAVGVVAAFADGII